MTKQPGIARYLELGLWLGLAALAYGLSFQFADEPGSYKWGPASWPRAIAVIMLLGALVNFATAGRRAGDRAEVAPPAPGQRLRRWLATAGIFVLPLIYVALLPFMGFYVATPLFLVALLFYLGERRPVFLVGVPLLIFVLVNLVFTVLFFVALPTGTWPGFYDVSNWFLVTVR